jgi:epoxyqueuosine reductase
MNTISQWLKIKEKALELGFDELGVASPQDAKSANRFQDWLELGYEGEMLYMRRNAEKRSNMEKVLPGIRSVLCLRSNYFPGRKNLDYLKNKEEGDISIYALNEDYHDIILPKLKELESFIQEEFPECESKVYVDTGPVLEKPLAQKAGLGWVGKHTNLVTEGIGSWYFLAEILLNIELPTSEEASDRCGTCQDCIDICPTRAIIAPYVLDSRKCISYLNIELKGVIPIEFRKAIGNRIYGCDDCQIVCPWNSFATVTYEIAYQETANTNRLIDLMQMDDEGFRIRFKGSPIKRIKRKRFLRNVAVALGNSENSEAAPVLEQALKDIEPLIRSHAVWALGEILGQGALPLLEEHLSQETDGWVLDEIHRLKKQYSPIL